MNTQQKLEVLRDRVNKLNNRLIYLGQLRPTIDQGNGWSRVISFEEMSEYAQLWMIQKGMFGEGVER